MLLVVVLDTNLLMLLLQLLVVLVEVVLVMLPVTLVRVLLMRVEMEWLVLVVEEAVEPLLEVTVVVVEME
tara:strand:- start:69 stop:278 length:210 start_codon:yes stop_codon:yes gene_type:complete